MPYVNSVIYVVRCLALGLLAVDLTLVVFILYRRAARNRYYAQKDSAQNRFSPVMADFFAGRLDLAAAVARLQTRRPAEREAVKSLLLSGIGAATRKRATELLVALGFVEKWAEQAFGKARARQLLQAVSERRAPAPTHISHPHLRRVRRLRLFAISRALAVGYLGRLSSEFSAVFAREALEDPSPYVGRLSVAALGRNHIAEGVPMLLTELRKTVAGETELPIRSMKTALVRYGTEQLSHFMAVMDDPLPRFRFLTVDTIREICRKAADPATLRDQFPAALRTWFLDKGARDDSADVRARTAAVIAYFHDAQAAQALRTLLRDDNEFVRLHALRACADPYYSALLGDVAQLVTDPRWRVREAAVRTLAQFGSQGRQRLEKMFLETSDRYASEQIAEELQRSRLGLQIVSALASLDGERDGAFQVCSKLVRLEMDSLLTEMLVDHASPGVRAPLLEVLSASNRPRFLAVLRQIAAQPTDPLQQRAEVLLRNIQTSATAAAGAAV